MMYVFDASFISALIIPDGKNPYTAKMYTKIKNEDEKIAPQLLWYELANIFKKLIRNRRYTPNEVLRFYSLLDAFCLTIDDEARIHHSQKLMRLSAYFNISSYSAAYLELAKRKKAVLCTLDESLWAAAKKYGVAVLK